MSSGNAIADHLREALQAALPTMDDAAVARLRGELHMVLAIARHEKLDGAIAAKVESALKSAGDLQTLASDVRALSASKRASETASVFDLAAVGILAVENVLTAERMSLFRILMSGLSEALVYAGSRQYVAGTEQVLAGLYRAQRVSTEDDLWDLALDLRGPDLSPEAAREVRAGIGGFFGGVDAASLPVDAKVAWVVQARVLVVILRCLALIDDLERSRSCAPS